MLKLAHIVNPLVVTDARSDLTYAQPLTLQSMRDARARVASDAVKVDLYAATYPEDAAAVPGDFTSTPPLERSVLDCVDAASRGRKLPLLKDILDRLYQAASDADYLIYTNVDIGLWPDFYERVAGYLWQGHDAFQVGRRTVSTRWTRVEDLPRILQEEGKPHYGLSCFVFPRAHYPLYRLHDTCIGLQPVGVTLAVNMIQRAENYANFGAERMTFHLGDERVWSNSLLDAWHVHNERTLDRVCDEIGPLKPAASELLRTYQRWRCNYVIDSCGNPMVRDFYRLARKLGFVDWVADRYALGARG